MDVVNARVVHASFGLFARAETHFAIALMIYSLCDQHKVMGEVLTCFRFARFRMSRTSNQTNASGMQ